MSSSQSPIISWSKTPSSIICLSRGFSSWIDSSVVAGSSIIGGSSSITGSVISGSFSIIKLFCETTSPSVFIVIASSSVDNSISPVSGF